MANLHIDYTQEGIDAIADGTGSFKLSGMKVSSDNSTWIDCDDLKWDGAVYSGRVTAPSDNYAINHVQVIFDTNSILCQDTPSSPGTIATLAASGNTIAISFKPNAECKACVTNTPSGGGGGGSIDPAILDAKQDKVLATPVKVLSWQTEATQVEQALATIKSSILQMDAFAYNNRLISKSTSSLNAEDSGTKYYKIASLKLSFNTILKGVIGELNTTQDGQDNIISHYDNISAFDIIANFNEYTTPHSCTITGYYDNILEHCDILVTSDDCIYVKLYKQGSEINSLIRCTISGGYDYEEAAPISDLPAGVEIIASMKDSATNLKTVPSSADLASKQNTQLSQPLPIDTSTESTVEGALHSLARVANNVTFGDPQRREIYNSELSTLYYKLADIHVGSIASYHGMLIDASNISKFDIIVRCDNTTEITGCYYNDIPSNCDIICSEGGLYTKLTTDAELVIIGEWSEFDDIDAIYDSATNSLPGTIQASLTNAIKLDSGGGGGKSGVLGSLDVSLIDLDMNLISDSVLSIDD